MIKSCIEHTFGSIVCCFYLYLAQFFVPCFVLASAIVCSKFHPGSSACMFNFAFSMLAEIATLTYTFSLSFVSNNTCPYAFLALMLFPAFTSVESDTINCFIGLENTAVKNMHVGLQPILSNSGILILQSRFLEQGILPLGCPNRYHVGRWMITFAESD